MLIKVFESRGEVVVASRDMHQKQPSVTQLTGHYLLCIALLQSKHTRSEKEPRQYVLIKQKQPEAPGNSAVSYMK